jgi:hypothetical protein
MLLFPFLGSLAVARAVRWESLAALIAILGIFLAQEPFLVLLRQWYLWKDRRSATSQAVFSLLVVGFLTGGAGAILFWKLPWQPLVVLAAAAVVLLLLRAALTLANRQRSALLQVVEAAGLSATCLLGYLSARGKIEEPAILLWTVFSLHHAAALFVIRARLEAVVAAKSHSSPQKRYRITAWVAQSVLMAVLLGAAAAGGFLLALAFAIPLALHTWDLLRLGSAGFLKIPLKRVGWREVAISTGFSVVAVASLVL